MIKLYLALNGLLYGGLSGWCTVRHHVTSRASGYLELSPSGNSEYLVVYGGLQAGLAVAYFWAATNASLYRTALVFSVFLYAPIVLYRVITVIVYSPVSALALATGALEVVLLVGAIALMLSHRAAA